MQVPKVLTLGAQDFVYTEELAGTAFENCIIPQELFQKST